MAIDPGGIRIRAARADEAQVLTQIAHAAKRFWGYPEELIALWKDALTITPDSLGQRPTFVAEGQGQIVGFIGLEFEAPTLEIEHLWVLPESMKRGIGRQLWEHAVGLCGETGCTRIELDSDPHARTFYEKMGARHIADVPSTPVGRLLPRMRYDVVSV